MIVYNPMYYCEDKRVGEQIFIDEKDAYVEYNADLISFLVVPGAITTDCNLSCGASDFNLYSSVSEPKTLQMSFYVGGASPEEAETNVSNFIRDCKNCVVSRMIDVYEYPAILTNVTVEDTTVDNYILISLESKVIRRMPLIEKSIRNIERIYNPGNVESGLKLRIKPENDLESLNICDVTIYQLKRNVSYIVDGIRGRVTANGINYFEHTDLIDFPKIQPGENIITMSVNVPVTLSFYPVFS